MYLIIMTQGDAPDYHDPMWCIWLSWSQVMHLIIMIPSDAPDYRDPRWCTWLSWPQVVHLTPDLNPATHHLIANEFLPDMPDDGLIFDPINKTFSLSEFVSKWK